MKTRASQLAQAEVFWQLKDFQGPPSNTGQGGADKLEKYLCVCLIGVIILVWEALFGWLRLNTSRWFFISVVLIGKYQQNNILEDLSDQIQIDYYQQY